MAPRPVGFGIRVVELIPLEPDVSGNGWHATFISAELVEFPFLACVLFAQVKRFLFLMRMQN